MRNIIFTIGFTILSIQTNAFSVHCRIDDLNGAEAGYLHMDLNKFDLTHSSKDRKCGTDVSDRLEQVNAEVFLYNNDISFKLPNTQLVVDRGCSEGNAPVFSQLDIPAIGVASDFNQYGGISISAEMMWKGDWLFTQYFLPKQVIIHQISNNLVFNAVNCH